MRASFAVILATVSHAAAGDAKFTFYRNVLPILQQHCQECHRPGEAGPMAFRTYAQTRPWAAAIREAVLSRKMPPWFAAGGEFSNDRRLTQAEIDTLAFWARDGAVEGDPNDAPRTRDFVDGWTIGQPDVVVDIGTDYDVPATGTLDYVTFVAPTGFNVDRWIEKLEIRPGNRAVVHHCIVYSRPPGSTWQKDARPGVPFLQGKLTRPSPFRPDDPGKFFMAGAEMLAVYVPGGVAPQLAPGQARLVPAGSDLVFSMHYTTNGKPGRDRTKVGIVFAKEPPRERVINMAVTTSSVRIPPGVANHRLDARATVHADVQVISLMPHMHVRGKAFEYNIKYPNGERQAILQVPRYDFNWQLTYYLSQPLLLPKGTEINITGWYDNSRNNPFNPDPTAEVVNGEQTWNEMLVGFLDFAIPPNTNSSTLAAIFGLQRSD